MARVHHKKSHNSQRQNTNSNEAARTTYATSLQNVDRPPSFPSQNQPSHIPSSNLRPSPSQPNMSTANKLQDLINNNKNNNHQPSVSPPYSQPFAQSPYPPYSQPSSSSAHAPPASSQPSHLPQNLKSTLKTPHDQQMSRLQTQYASLSPADRAQQDAWAQTQLQLNAGNCVAGFCWLRKDGGYRCAGGSHYVSDELLSEGFGGCWVVNLGAPLKKAGTRMFGEVWDGPFYGNEIRDYWPYAPAYGHPRYYTGYGRTGGGHVSHSHGRGPGGGSGYGPPYQGGPRFGMGGRGI